MNLSLGGSSAEHELASLSPSLPRPPAISVSERLARWDRARQLLKAQGLDALLINAGASLRYFTGLSWGPTERLVALLLPVDGDPVMVCPAFEEGSLKASLSVPVQALLWEEDQRPEQVLAGHLKAHGWLNLGLDPQLAFSCADHLRLAHPDLHLRNAASVIDGCRGIKSAGELACLSYAKQLTLEVHRHAARILRAGISTTEVKRFIDAAHRALGADNGSTFCAVQFGIATAYPHGVPGEQYLALNELVLIDTGCQIEGYHSDITRTYVFGEATAEQKHLWAVEKAAQAAAFAAVKPGVLCEAIDAAARAVLESHGLGPNYRLPGLPHRTGHGVGLSIHEGPYLVRGDTTPLAPGMCFSNEPMIVVPDRFGIRLEDHLYVTADGAAWFTEPQHALNAPFG